MSDAVLIFPWIYDSYGLGSIFADSEKFCSRSYGSVYGYNDDHVIFIQGHVKTRYILVDGKVVQDPSYVSDIKQIIDYFVKNPVEAEKMIEIIQSGKSLSFLASLSPRSVATAIAGNCITGENVVAGQAYEPAGHTHYKD
jgi:hypothetical protein